MFVWIQLSPENKKQKRIQFRKTKTKEHGE